MNDAPAERGLADAAAATDLPATPSCHEALATVLASEPQPIAFHSIRSLQRDRVDAVWDAIALHSSTGIAARRIELCAATQAGAWADFGANTDRITNAQAAAIHRAYPREAMTTALADAIIEQADGRPEKAPRYSLADALINERAGLDGLTRMERDAPHSRWGTT